MLPLERYWIRLLFLPLLFAGAAFAQFNSSVEGTVTDPTHAGVPGAHVVLVNEGTQVTQRTTTSENGFFRIKGLAPGAYRLEVSGGGFKTWIQTNLVLQGSEVRSVYPTLALGEQAARVEVNATVNAIETSTSKVSRSVEEKTIAEVPMVGRNAYGAIIALAPCVTGSGQLFASGAANAQDSFQPEPGFQLNAAGQRQEQNEYQVDGTSVNGNSRDGIANLTPEPDTIQEIRVSANSFSAEKGRNSGALVEVFTKSGTNNWHGTLSEFHTDNALSARTIFQSTIPASRRNEYGFTLGGPVIKNQTFIFGSYYGLNTSTNSTSVVREETPEFANYVKANFPDSMAAKYFTLDAPLAYPTTAINTVAQVRQSNPGSFPSTSFPSNLPAVGTATITQPVPAPSKQWNARVDQNLFGYKDRVYANWFGTYSNPIVVSTRKALTYPYPTTNQFGRLNWTHTITPSLLNEASFSVVRAGGWYPPASGEAANLPNVNITGISTGFNQAGYYRWQHNNYIMHDGVSWIHGSHQLRFGADIDRQQGYAVQSNLARPTFQFSNILDFSEDLPFSQSGPTIDIAPGDTAINLYRKLYTVYVGAYVQDDWKITKTLTLNAGLRWDYFGHWATGQQGVIPFRSSRRVQDRLLRNRSRPVRCRCVEAAILRTTRPRVGLPGLASPGICSETALLRSARVTASFTAGWAVSLSGQTAATQTHRHSAHPLLTFSSRARCSAIRKEPLTAIISRLLPGSPLTSIRMAVSPARAYRWAAWIRIRRTGHSVSSTGSGVILWWKRIIWEHTARISIPRPTLTATRTI